MSVFFDRTIIKFLLVGILNTFVGSGLMFLLYNLVGLSYWVSSIANYVVGSILSFFLNKYFTFQKKGWSWSQVSKFVLNIVVCYLLAYGAAKPLILYLMSGQSIKIQENIAMLIGMCLFTGLNYLGQRFFAFHNKKENNNEKKGE